MKNSVLGLLCCLIMGIPSNILAQTNLLHTFIPETNQSFDHGVVTDGTYLYGNKWDGGDFGKGYIYRVKIDNSDFSILLSFDGENSGKGGFGSLVLKDDMLYGITNMGGAFDSGTLYKIKTDGSNYSKLFDFGPDNCRPPIQSLLIEDNIIYGSAAQGAGGGLGGSNGSIFSISTDGEDFSIIFSFDGANGWNPSSPLIKQGDFLYGTTSRGGTNDNGVVFKIKTNGDEFTVLKDDFAGDISVMPNGNLVIIENTIYGATSQGGTGNAGLIYKINTDGTAFEVLNDLGTLEGSNPTGLTLYESNLYGMTVNGGYSGGIIFKVEPSGDNFAVLHRFDKQNGANPSAALTVLNDQLFGYTNNGEYNYGVVFSIDPDGSNYRKIIDIEATNSGYSSQGPLVVTPLKGYGFTNGGGVYNNGVIYSLDPDGQNYQVLHNFSGIDGAMPTGYMVLSNDTLFGMTQEGGTNGTGIIFSYTLDNNHYNKLYDFNYASGHYPNGPVTKLGSKIYGVAGSGGTDNRGILFEMNTDGSEYKTIIDFAETDITRPRGPVLHLNSVFYGIASNFSTDYLMVYSVGLDGTDFKVLYESDGIDAGRYGESITTDSTYLYVITKQGGLTDNGVLFKIKTDGTEFSKLLDFGGTIGASPIAPLLLEESILYISTYTGGPGGFGNAIGIKTDGTGLFDLLDYGDLFTSYFNSAANTTKSTTEHHKHLLKSTTSGFTIAALSMNDNNIYLVSEQTYGNNTQGHVVKYELTPLNNHEISTQQQLKIHPNPASDFLNIEHEKSQIKVQVFNISGIKVLEKILDGKTLDISHLPSGMYILNVDNKTTKFIKG